MTGDIARLEWSGGWVSHQPPVVLFLDHRANHLFSGWQEHFADLKAELLRRYPAATEVWSFDGSVWGGGPLADLKPASQIALPAQHAENPGGLPGLKWLVDRLLGPGGCPWDQAQTHATLKKYLIEESYELIDAIDRGDEAGLKEELGDVLLQPLMHGQIKALEGKWDSDAIADLVVAKLIGRHPHVFGEVEASTEEEVLRNWDQLKRQERGPEKQSILAGIPRAMPSLLLALEVSKRAARSGFEWETLDDVWAKVREEEAEVKAALQAGNREEVQGEIGDLLFTIVNIARWAKVDPEEALRHMVTRFISRFQTMESLSDKPLAELSPEAWDGLWNRAKAMQG